VTGSRSGQWQGSRVGCAVSGISSQARLNNTSRPDRQLPQPSTEGLQYLTPGMTGPRTDRGFRSDKSQIMGWSEAEVEAHSRVWEELSYLQSKNW